MSKRERAIIFLLAALNFTHNLDFMIMVPLNNYLLPDLQIKTYQFSLLVGSYSLSAVFSGILLASLIDRFDRKKVLVVVYAGFILGTVACGLASSYHLLLTARVVTGIFGGIIGGQVFSIISDLFAYERRGMAVGWTMTAFAIAMIVGVPVSLYLTNLFHFNWHVPFLMIGGIGVILMPLIIKILPPLRSHVTEKKGKQSRFDALIKVIQNPSQGMALIFTMLMMIGHFLIIPFINSYMEFNMGYSKEQIPMVYVVGGVASFLSAIYLGKISDKVGKFRIFTISVVISSIMVIAISNMLSVRFVWVLPFFAVWFIFGTSRSVTAQALVTNVVEKEQQGSFMVLNSSMQHFGTFIASMIAGYVVVKDPRDRILHFEWLGYLSVIILFACLFLGRFIFLQMDRHTRAARKMKKEVHFEASPVE